MINEVSMIGTAGPNIGEMPASHATYEIAGAAGAGVRAGIADVLFEQLAYLIEFADQEPRRFERVTAVLLEAFN